jgi:hypothetical protein
MDLLYAGNINGFCLVSSDSDFTRLATRLREAGKTVYGMGERKTPEAFISACDKFIFFEVLKPAQPRGSAPSAPASPLPDVPELQGLLTVAVQTSARDNGWALLSAVGDSIAKNNPSFDARNYGFGRLGELVRKQPYLEVRETPDGTGVVHLHVRLKADGGPNSPSGLGK